MGKNPNAKKLKEKKKGMQKEYGHDIESLEEEAARRGCAVWDLDEVRREQDEIENDSDSDENNSQDEDQDDKAEKNKPEGVDQLSKDLN